MIRIFFTVALPVPWHVSHVFGWPIGAWCVRDIEDYSNLFDSQRNNRAYTFNEGLYNWNTAAGAKNMRYMFYNATQLNQDVSDYTLLFSNATINLDG